MDKVIAARLNENSEHYDSNLFGKLAKTAHEYLQAGLSTLQYYTADLDAANDIVQLYAPVTKAEFEKRDRMAPNNFIHPMAATEITTLATGISQILFGAQTARRVEARQDDDEEAAKNVNELLQYNDDQQPMYLQGYLWCWDACTFNRGVFYERWRTKYQVDKVPIEEYDITGEPIPVMRLDGRGPRMRGGEIVTEYPKYTRWKTQRTPVAGYTHLDLVSPYDAVFDPMFPMLRMQEGRFAGHRVMIAWHELKRRSELPPEDPDYVLPTTVQKLKTRKNTANTNIITGGTQPTHNSTSRSYYERQKRGAPQGNVGATGAASKDDGGVVECFAIIIRAKPKTYDLFDDEEAELIEILISGQTELLSVNVLPNKHDEFPYCVGEARPNAHHQFSSGWALVIKPIQDYVDYLKRRHQESQSRTSGNIFIGDPACIDFEAFTDPSKDGLLIPITAEGAGKPFDQIIKQIPVIDTTKDFVKEMDLWITHAETATGAHAVVQGETEDPSQTATQFEGTQQMAMGRISSVARNLSTGALVPQTRRMVCNFQQFMPEEMVVRITGDIESLDGEEPVERYRTIRESDIQGEFDIIAHDGSLPGTDTRKVAAMSRALEAAANPVFAQYFDDTVPGNLNPRRLLFETLKAGGMPMKNFIIDKETAMKNLISRNMAQGIPMTPPGAPPMAPGAPPAPLIPGLDGTPMPSASELPPTPSAEPPPPGPIPL